ncbi:hypothetical protein KIPB_005966, partial [Kipferlia bialata]|eukprot:g5966.t1
MERGMEGQGEYVRRNQAWADDLRGSGRETATKERELYLDPLVTPPTPDDAGPFHIGIIRPGRSTASAHGCNGSEGHECSQVELSVSASCTATEDRSESPHPEPLGSITRHNPLPSESLGPGVLDAPLFTRTQGVEEAEASESSSFCSSSISVSIPLSESSWGHSNRPSAMGHEESSSSSDYAAAPSAVRQSRGQGGEQSTSSHGSDRHGQGSKSPSPSPSPSMLMDGQGKAPQSRADLSEWSALMSGTNTSTNTSAGSSDSSGIPSWAAGRGDYRIVNSDSSQMFVFGEAERERENGGTEGEGSLVSVVSHMSEDE